MQRKIVSVLLAAALVMTAFAGCSKPSTNQPQVTNQDSKPQQKITLKVLKGKAAHEVPADQMDVFKAYEEKTGIHIQWDNPPAESFKERYNLVMASGDLPDIIMDMPSGDVLKYAQMGVLIPLNDQISKNSPNLKSWLEKRPEIKKAITFKDGKVYYFPMFDEFPLGNNALGVREDWMKKLNIQSPVTTDDWYNLLKAFKEKDPNGNGKQDEIPFSGNGIGTARSLIAGWGIIDGFYNNPKDGKIHYGPIDDRYKEALTWIAKLYNEGLIDKEIATNDEKAFQGKMAQNLIGSFRGSFGSHFTTFNTTLPKQIPGFRVMGTAPLKGPYGDQIHAGLDMSPRSGVIAAVITKANKYVDQTVKWIDYWYSTEGAIMMNFGIEGKTYTMQNGKPIYTDLVMKNPNGLSPKQARGTFSITQSTGPYVFMKAQSDQSDDPAVKETKDKYIAPFIDASKKYVLPSLSFEAKDDEVRRQVMADVQTYTDEMITKFILGQEPITNWDKYVQKVKSMGIDKAIQVYQTAYNDWNK